MVLVRAHSHPLLTVFVSHLSLLPGMTLIFTLFQLHSISFYCSFSRHPHASSIGLSLWSIKYLLIKEKGQYLPFSLSPHSLCIHLKKHHWFQQRANTQMQTIPGQRPARHQVNVLFGHISKLSGKWDKNCKHTPVFQLFLSLWVSLGIGQTRSSMLSAVAVVQFWEGMWCSLWWYHFLLCKNHSRGQGMIFSPQYWKSENKEGW